MAITKEEILELFRETDRRLQALAQQSDDIRAHLERLERFKRLSPQHAGYRVMGAVAAMVVPDETARYAYRLGLFVLGQSGDTMTLRNDSQFEPKVW
jgi:hypothetical protein